MKPLSAFFALALAAGAVAVRAAGAHSPSEPPRGFGASITGAFEGWFDNPDGSHNFLVGYLNRNPIAARSTCRSGRTTASSPAAPTWASRRTSCPAGRPACSWSRCPKEFTPEQRLTWTIIVNGQTTSIPLRLHIDYNVSPFRFAHRDVTNTPPVLRLDENGPAHPGPDRHGLAGRC